MKATTWPGIWLTVVRRSRVQTEAAAMSFISLLALIPALILTAWFISKLPKAIADITYMQAFLLRLIVPESAELVSNTIASLLQRTSSISLVVFPILLLSIIGLMNGLEQSFNRIFEMPPRRFIARVLYICTTLIVGPILLALTLASTELIPLFGLLGWIDSSLYLSALPFITEVVTLTCMYQLVPSHPIGWKLALTAGSIMAILIEVLRQLLQQLLFGLGSYEILYGIFAAVPLFCIWVYSFWLTVFILATLIHSIRNMQQITNQNTHQ